MKKKFPFGFVTLAVLLALAIGVGAVAVTRERRYQARLREVYDGAMLSALRQMEDMQLSLSKALLSGDAGMSAQYLSAVSSGASQVQRSLSLLPLSHTATQSAVKFANQLSDYADTLIAGQSLSEADAAQLDALIAACEEYAAALYQARESLAVQAVAGNDAFYPVEESAAYDSAVSYPTLIYDGPFSDARETGAAKGISGREITREEAGQIARDFVGADRILSIAQGADMGGAIPCYGITLRLGDVTLEAAVSKTGGKMLWLSPDSADFAAQKSVEECREAALTFLSSRGYENMRATYFQVYQGVTVISFAATQGETLLYPDLIKVQLRLDTAQVVGWEARNYLQNHAARPTLSPAITAEEAQGAVSSRLQIEATQLCLIPLEGGERLCYEFRGTYKGHVYLAYIDAETGKQVELMKVIEGEAGLEAA